MQAEGQSMADHGRVMAEDIAGMLAGHDVAAPAAADLREAAQDMRTVGDHLALNGQEMINYADRMLRSLGYP
jgi:hypothetical protein